jgi:5'-methylthioadenosine phosphorylase
MIGIIGGTGLYKLDNLEGLEAKKVETPFGRPSADILVGQLGSKKIAFLPRHGTHHEIGPSEINYRANIWALKSVGVRRIISVSAVGSLVQKVAPGDLAIPSQYFDWTRGQRKGTFFQDGLVAHISTAQPSCRVLSDQLEKTAKQLNLRIHANQTYACIEGPRFGTRAESFFLKGAGCHLVGMTNIPEAFLAREAQMCYCTVAIATDYDCWLDDPIQHATVEKVMALYMTNLGRVKEILQVYIQLPDKTPTCHCRESLDGAIMTPESSIAEEKRQILNFLRN